MSIKFKKIAIAAMLGVSFTASAGNKFIIKQGIMGMVETSKEKPFYTSCLDLKNTIPKSKSGTYLIKPNGEGKEALNLYCDMDTDGGGWTLAFKTSNFATGNPIYNARNPGVLKDLAFGSSNISHGNITRFFPHKEVLAYSNSSNYLVVNATFAQIGAKSCYVNEGVRCLALNGKIKMKKGLPTVNQDSALVFGYNYNAMSSIMIGRGTYEPWCYIQHGRYNGLCLDGSVGLGNWAILVR